MRVLEDFFDLQKGEPFQSTLDSLAVDLLEHLEQKFPIHIVAIISPISKYS